MIGTYAQGEGGNIGPYGVGIGSCIDHYGFQVGGFKEHASGPFAVPRQVPEAEEALKKAWQAVGLREEPQGKGSNRNFIINFLKRDPL